MCLPIISLTKLNGPTTQVIQEGAHFLDAVHRIGSTQDAVTTALEDTTLRMIPHRPTLANLLCASQAVRYDVNECEHRFDAHSGIVVSNPNFCTPMIPPMIVSDMLHGDKDGFAVH